MSTVDGRYTIVFNGEIYNYRELQKELRADGTVFNSDSDTEVLLKLYARDGCEMLSRLEGMYAFVIWDEIEQTCFLVRDPLGIKPLYYRYRDGQLAFASELRCLLDSNLGPKTLDDRSVAEYLLFGSFPETGTIIAEIQSLPAGHKMFWSKGEILIESFWKPRFGSQPISRDDALQVTRDALNDSVRRHLVSDVPVGIFLSGGIDSSALVALAQANGTRDIQTFCISFEEQEYNEGELAARTAAHFGTIHHDWRLTASDGKKLVKEFLSAVDSPSNDGFNTYCVAKFAKESGMKVVLSGLGGDELFGSYPSFQNVPRILNLWKRLRGLGDGKKVVGRLLEKFAGNSKMQRLGMYLQSDGGPLAAYWTMRGFFTPREAALLLRDYLGHDVGFDVAELLRETLPSLPTVQDTVSYLESTRYMRQQLLRDSDVFSMAHGLELRVPFVDRKLFDAINAIPAAMRLESGKRLLCDAVPSLPEWVINAPKRGFRFPFEDWVNAQWKDEFADLQRRSPVRLGSWYRKWTLFTLEHFLTVHGIT